MVLADGAGAKFRRVEGMHRVRYIEVFLAGRDAKSGKVVAACYNPMLKALSVPNSKDAAPQS